MPGERAPSVPMRLLGLFVVYNQQLRMKHESTKCHAPFAGGCMAPRVRSLQAERFELLMEVGTLDPEGPRCVCHHIIVGFQGGDHDGPLGLRDQLR